MKSTGRWSHTRWTFHTLWTYDRSTAKVVGMSFQASMYEKFVAAGSQAGERLIPQYIGTRPDFDIVIVGSGIGGGVLADALAELDKPLRILVLEAGSFLY